MTDKPEFEVKEVRTEITVPHQGKRITFVAPHFGPGTYAAVGKQIDESGLLRPTFAETVSLVYSATQNQDNKYAKYQVLGALKGGWFLELFGSLRDRWFWGFNRIRFEPKEGAFISDRNRQEIHVPFGFETEDQSLEAFVKNPFVLALAEGDEGVEKLVKIAESQKLTPSNIWGFKNVYGTEYALCALDPGGVARLFFPDYACIHISDCCAFGLLPEGEGK